MGMPTANCLKPDVVPTIFARLINYLEPSNTCNASISKPTSQPMFEKLQQKLVSLQLGSVVVSVSMPCNG